MDYFIDSHYHLDFVQEGELRNIFLKYAKDMGIKIIGQTVLASDYQELVQKTDDNFYRASLGFHPWWVRDKAQIDRELLAFEECLGSTRLIGEIGLDFAPKRLELSDMDLQIEVFTRILSMVGQEADKTGEKFILSIHGVKSATKVLDIIEDMGLQNKNIILIFHWFSGTSDELTRLIKMGGYVSANPMMLEGKRGRAYVKQIPGDRILLETDLPEGKQTLKQNKSVEERSIELAQQVKDSLDHTLRVINESRDQDMKEQILSNQKYVFDL